MDREAVTEVDRTINRHAIMDGRYVTAKQAEIDTEQFIDD